MAVATKYATGADTAKGNVTYSNPGNVSADDGAYATVTIARRITGDEFWLIPAFTEVSATDTINSVLVEIQWRASAVNDTTRTFELYTGSTVKSGTVSGLVNITADTTESFSPTCTAADVRGDNGYLNVLTRFFPDNDDTTYYIDFVRVTVDYTVSGTNYTQNPADSVSGPDAFTAKIDATRSGTDTAVSGDVASAVQQISRTSTEHVAAADSLYHSRNVNLAPDAANIVDSVNGANSRERTAADLTGAIDTATHSVDASRTFADVAHASDIATAEFVIPVDINDNAAVTDNAQNEILFERAINDNAAVGDITSYSIAATRTINDTSAATDTVGVSFSGQFNDTGSATDAVTTAHDVSRATSDNAAAIDGFNFQTGTAHQSADVASAIDFSSFTKNTSREVIDAAAASDDAVAQRDVSVVAHDTASGVDRATTKVPQELRANAAVRVTASGDVRTVSYTSTAAITALVLNDIDVTVRLSATVSVTIAVEPTAISRGPERANFSVNTTGSLTRIIPLTGNAKINAGSQSSLRVVRKLGTMYDVREEYTDTWSGSIAWDPTDQWPGPHDTQFAMQLFEEPILARKTSTTDETTQSYSRPFMLVRS